MPFLITKKEADAIFKSSDGIIKLSLDLGISKKEILKENGYILFENEKIDLKKFEKLKENRIYFFNEDMQPVVFFSEETNIYYKLFPTDDWPTITLSSTPMHRHKNISPKGDTLLKIKEISPVQGIILDTCCGLGYTAICSAKDAEKVFTFEKDEVILHIDKINPYSLEIFNNPKIVVSNQDIYEAITNFQNNFFHRIIHDPPTFKYAGELYSGEFYKRLYSVLKPGGIIYHYCPAPQKTQGREFWKEIEKRLNSAGFTNIEYHGWSSGIKAIK